MPSLYKVALCDVYSIDSDVHEGKVGLIKMASGRILIEPGSDKAKIVESEIKKHPTALFFRAKAIKADEPNSNGDYFSEAEILKSYKTFEGVPFFTNHDNQNIENAKGKIVFAEWVPEEKAVYVIAFSDREAFPHICRSIEQEYITGVSMGFLGINADITMGDLTSKKICEINVGDNVLTPYGNVCEVEKIYSDVVARTMYELNTTTYHKSPLLSDDHPVFLIDSEDIKKQQKISLAEAQSNKYLRRKGKISQEKFCGQDSWRRFRYTPKFKETKDIKEGDYVLIPSKYKITIKEDYDKDFYYLAGAYLGDGYISLNKKEENYGLAYYIGLLEKSELGKKICNLLPKYTDSNVVQTPFESKNGLKIVTYDKHLADIIYGKFGKMAHEKRIYQKEFTKEQICALVSGYIDTDGTITKTYGKKQNGEIRGNGIRGSLISSCNQKLLEDVQSLLILIDVPSYITWNYRIPNKNSVVKVPTMEFSLFIPYSNLHLFTESIKLNNASVAKSDVKAGKIFIFTSENGQKYLACPVKDVTEQEYTKMCYDLKVKGDESYIADGIAVHNCSVEYSFCNICGNKAEKTEDFCGHIKERKGRKFSGRAKDVVTGEVKEFTDQLVFEYNYGLKFIELSAVVDPACPSCHIEGIIKNDEYFKKVANIQNSLYMIKTAALEKHAGQEEITQLNDVLQTLENIAVQLIKNRKQVEVEFSSDLVGILSDLQKFVDELTGAGYGNIQSQPGQVPGVSNLPPSLPETNIPPASQSVPGVNPVSEEMPIPQTQKEVGTISGSPSKPLVQVPKLPITAPKKPMAFDSDKMQKISKSLKDLQDKIVNLGELDMGKRLTSEERMNNKKIASETLSNSWKEKGELLEYIYTVPSIQDNMSKLSVKKRDDTFIIVAESKIDNGQMVWTFEDLNNNEKELIKQSPKEAALHFLETFNKKSNKIQQGDTKMSKDIKEAGANTVNKEPQVITESQLRQKDIYHSRTNESVDVIAEKQLDGDRNNKESEVITEAQLAAKTNKLNPRTEESPEVITQAQLEGKAGASPRKEEDANEITQAQLDANKNRIGTEPNVITEKQLSNVSAPWERAAKRDGSMFKSAGDHMKSVVDVLANTVISTGCTPCEASKIVASLIDSTKGRYELQNAILDATKDEEVDYSKRLAYWSTKNIKVAGVGTEEIAASIVKGLRKLASDLTINPEVVIDALDVVSENEEGITIISKKVDEKLESAKKETVKASKKQELRSALKDILASKTDKETRDEERKEVLASVSAEEGKIKRDTERKEWMKTVAGKTPDTVIETSFSEMGCTKEDPNFKKMIKSFAKGALASQNIKLAAVTNVTINGDTVSIAVQTDDVKESVEIPIGEKTIPEGDTLPEGDLAGEGLENQLPPEMPEELNPQTGLPQNFAASKKVKKEAQLGGAGGGIPGTPGGLAGGPGASEANLPGTTPEDQALGSLTTDEQQVGEVADTIPTAGEQQMPYSICPECGSADVDIEKSDEGNITGKCKGCGAEYEALVKKEVEFRVTKPTKSVGEDVTSGAPEAPEVPVLPVAAQTSLTKDTIVRIASNKEKYGYVCPSCGMTNCKASSDKEGHAEFTCPACKTQVDRDIIVNVNNPESSHLRVKWDVVPNVAGCAGCKEGAKKFASMIKVEKMIKSAEAIKDQFPMANCVERVARKFGGNSTATFGPCKGQALAKCVCEQLQKLGLTKVNHLEKLASVYTQEDPMDKCIEDQMKKKYSKKESETLCACLKKKFASASDDNVFLQAFAQDKSFTEDDLNNINEVFNPDTQPTEDVVEEDIDISAPIEQEIEESKASADQEIVTIEVTKETAKELADAALQASEEVEVEVEVDEGIVEPGLEVSKVEESPIELEVEENIINPEEEKEMATAMQNHKILKVAEGVIKVAATPKVVKDIEGNVDAGVPRAKATMGKEGPDNIDKPMATPNVPRSNATMGKEGPDNINKPAGLPDVAVDSAYMGVEKEIQKGMPAINNEIKGTVIATNKQAKELKEVETVEKDVDAGVPRAKATMGKEGPDNIDKPMAKPSVPRANAEMGNESSENINPKVTGPDVPIDSAYMGSEKEVQKDMPAINNEILKNVQQKKDVQLERIANARKIKAIEVTAKLLATSRVTEEAYEDVIEALSRFEIDKIASVADKMYPRQSKKASLEVANKDVHSIPSIVMESKEVTSSTNDFMQKLASHFTIGSKSFDESLSKDGDK